jgi:hypothetical protein
MSRGIRRVADALVRYKPTHVQIVDAEEEAELQIVHMVGNGQRQRWHDDPPRPYAVVQYCLRTTELPNTRDWLTVWSRAKSVWSYYDLFHLCLVDNAWDWAGGHRDPFNFYHAPLGTDSTTFRPSQPARKNYLIGTSGFIAETEGIREAHAACQRLNRMQLHLGPNLEIGDDITYIRDVPDGVLADFWSRCSFVAGLRRCEGFELPAVEGLLCGSRAIVFDAPHYRRWFEEHAEYVPETDAATPELLVEALVEVMSKPVRPVTPAERTRITQKFDWSKLVAGFWEAIL